MKLSHRLTALASELKHPKDNFHVGDLVVLKDIFRNEGAAANLTDTLLVVMEHEFPPSSMSRHMGLTINVGYYRADSTTYHTALVDPRWLRLATEQEIESANAKIREEAQRAVTLNQSPRNAGGSNWILEPEINSPEASVLGVSTSKPESVEAKDPEPKVVDLFLRVPTGSEQQAENALQLAAFLNGMSLEDFSKAAKKRVKKILRAESGGRHWVEPEGFPDITELCSGHALWVYYHTVRKDGEVESGIYGAADLPAKLGWHFDVEEAVILGYCSHGKWHAKHYSTAIPKRHAPYKR